MTFKQYIAEKGSNLLEEKKKKKRKRKKRSSKRYGWGFMGYGHPGMYAGIADAAGGDSGGGDGGGGE